MALATENPSLNGPFNIRARGLNACVTIALAVKTKNSAHDKRKILALLDNSLTTLEFFVLWRLFSQKDGKEPTSTIRDSLLYNKSSVIRMSLNKSGKSHMNSNLYTAPYNTGDLIDLINAVPVSKLAKRLDSPMIHGILIVVDCPFCYDTNNNFTHYNHHLNHLKRNGDENNSIETRKYIWKNILSENQGMFALKNYLTSIIINMNKFRVKNSLPLLPLGIVVDHDDKVCLLSMADSQINEHEKKTSLTPNEIITEYEARRNALYSFMEFDTLLKYSQKEVEEHIKIVHTTLLCNNTNSDSSDKSKNQSSLASITRDVHQYKIESESLFDGLVCWVEDSAKKYASSTGVTRIRDLNFHDSSNTTDNL